MQRPTFPIVASSLAVVFTLLLTIAPASFARKVFEGGGADQDVIDRIEDAKEQVTNDSGSQSPTSTTATIHGAVFYNDQRTHGLFADRWDRLRTTPTRHRSATCSITITSPAS